MKSMVEISNEFLKPVLHRQAICIDATVGNGKDSQFFLSQKVRKVYGFEIQADVLAQTKTRIQDGNWMPILAGHETMDAYVQEEVDAIIFNFGFCPNEDETITTLPQTSAIAVKKSLQLLKRKGRMALVLYPHLFSDDEQQTIETILSGLSNHAFQIYKIQTLNVQKTPYFIGIEKR